MKSELKELKTNEAEGNKFIAKFMGLPSQNVHGELLYSHTNYEGEDWGYELHNLEYHKSWDWLMPVVAKIAEYRMAHPKETGWVCDCKIVVYQRILYREVVNFCKWFVETQGAEG